jgi:hypothetical protein
MPSPATWFGHQKNAIALAGNSAANEFFRTVHLRRIDQRHPERKAGAQRLLFLGLRTSSLSKIGRALAQSRYDGAIAKFHCPIFGG